MEGVNFIAGAAGRLEYTIDLPDSEPKSLAIICHPHTLHGGTLTNKVVHQLARSFVDLDAVVVRFNFRGAGASEGEYDAGIGESDDLEQVVDWARQQWPDRPLWLAGFSFGAYVALASENKLAPDELVAVAPPVNLYAFDAIHVALNRWLLIQGADDEIVPSDAVIAWSNTLSQKPHLALVPDAGHFFHGRLNDLKATLAAYFAPP